MKRHATITALLTVLAPARAALAQAATPRTLGDDITRTLAWLVIAGIVFTAAFKVIDWTTPGDLRKQIAEGNVALAIYAGSLAIAIAIIIGHLLS